MLPPPGKAGEAASILVDADQSQRGYNAPAATYSRSLYKVCER
jgi:hypothetical protein